MVQHPGIFSLRTRIELTLVPLDLLEIRGLWEDCYLVAETCSHSEGNVLVTESG